MSSGAGINAMDSHGRTALGWAALRNDERAVQALLEAGADPNICDHRGRTTFTDAARLTYVFCAEVMLAVKTDPSWNVIGGETPLHSAASTPSATAKNIKRMVAAGGDPNLRDKGGNTPLAYAAVRDNCIAVACLLDLGADVNYLGDTTLFTALQFRSNDTLQLLLARGADYSRHDSLGNSVVHAAAAFGDVRTLEVLLRADLQGVDPDASDRQGKTASKLARARTDQAAGFVEKVEELLADIRARNMAMMAYRDDIENIKDEVKASSIRPIYTLYQAIVLPIALFSGTIWMEPLLWPWLDQAAHSIHQRIRCNRFYSILESPETRLQRSRWMYISFGWAVGILCGLLLGLELPGIMVIAKE